MNKIENKVMIVDISGKVPEYDEELCQGLAECGLRNDILFIAPYEDMGNFGVSTIKLINLTGKWLPHGVLRRLIKLIEIHVNYFKLFRIVARYKPSVIQMEWLPLIEKVRSEIYFLKIIKRKAPDSKIILKIHNVYPHNCITKKSRGAYEERFKKVAAFADEFIVHTMSSKKEVSEVFDIKLNKVHIIHHGVFKPKDYVVKDREIGKDGRWNLLMYGIQSRYKGADILVNALRLLPAEIKERLNVSVVGMMNEDYLKEVKSVDTGVNLTINPKFVEFPELYKLIDNSDAILLPYRKISQSGVLLLAMYFKRCLITSDLNSFRETLEGFQDDWFFKSEDPQALANLIEKYVIGQIDIDSQIRVIQDLNERYSWKEAGRLNIELYNEID